MKIVNQLIGILLLVILSNCLYAQINIVTYAGNSANEVFYDVMQISDGSILVVGGADNLDWIADDIPRTQFAFNGNIPNSLGTNRYGFILKLSSDLQSIQHVTHFAQGVVEDIRFIKSNTKNYDLTSDLYISCSTEDTDDNNGGYVICKLNNNFVEGIPDSFDWMRVVWAKTGPKQYHPWDVAADGRVYYVSGESHGYDWSALYCLNQSGERMKVENWRTHWRQNGTEFRGTPASSNPDESTNPVNYSGVVLKTWGRCELRSLTQEDFDVITPDGNGGTRKGKWPLDLFFDSPCDFENPVTNGPGYSGYSQESCCPVFGATCIVVDKETNNFYVGLNVKSYSVEFESPDFEPAVIAFDDTGELLWWSRLYHEITPEGDTMVSLPDQYVDALAIDYQNNKLVVGARAHGNNTENFWEGNTIASDPSAYGFQNQFTGTNGNIHESWIGKLNLDNGVLTNSTYMAELAEGTGGLGIPHPDPNLASWPDPNSGWPDVNTTRLSVNNMKVSSTGDVIVIAEGRRTMTTANAYQQNISPYDDGMGCWNSFVRVYDEPLRVPKYSSLVVGQWDPLTQEGGGNIKLYGVWKNSFGVICVGKQNATNNVSDGNPIPLINVPQWGQTAPEGESAVIVYYQASNLYNEDDQYGVGIGEQVEAKSELTVFPNPAKDHLKFGILGAYHADFNEYAIYTALGILVKQGKCKASENIDLSGLAEGLYCLRIKKESIELSTSFIVNR